MFSISTNLQSAVMTISIHTKIQGPPRNSNWISPPYVFMRWDNPTELK